MKNRTKRLGRGLGALIPGGDAAELRDHIVKIPLEQIQPNTKQPRRHFDPEKIDELAQSIKKNGVLQPVIVRQISDDPEQYELVVGERRLKASQIVGLEKIPAIVKEIDEDQLLQIALIENIQREDLNPIEEAQAYDQLIAQWAWTQEELADQVGKSRSAITNALRLLKLSPEIQNHLINGDISMGHARALLALPDEKTQKQFCQLIIEKKLSVREIENLIKNQAPLQKKATKSKPKSPEIVSLEDNLRTFFGTKVTIRQKSKSKGSIQIEYYSQDDLDRIIEQIRLHNS